MTLKFGKVHWNRYDSTQLNGGCHQVKFNYFLNTIWWKANIQDFFAEFLSVIPAMKRILHFIWFIYSSYKIYIFRQDLVILYNLAFWHPHKQHYIKVLWYKVAKLSGGHLAKFESSLMVSIKTVASATEGLMIVISNIKKTRQLIGYGENMSQCTDWGRGGVNKHGCSSWKLKKRREARGWPRHGTPLGKRKKLQLHDKCGPAINIDEQKKIKCRFM